MTKPLLWMKLLSVLIMLSACSSSNSLSKTSNTPTAVKNIDIPINYSLFHAEGIEVTTEQEIFELSPSQQEKFLADYNEIIRKGAEPHKALSDYLEGQMDSFTYYGETYTAEEAMRFNAGNCMSLAILTTALSKLVNLEFSYREVNTLPVFEKNDNIIFSSSHVQTTIYDPRHVESADYMYFARPAVTIDYFPISSNINGRKLSLSTFLASYYQNIASDALVENKLDKSFAYALKAKAMDPNNTKVLNFIAVLHKRKGDLSTAEQIYQIGLENNSKSVALLSNYINLLRTQQRWGAADKIQLQLDDLNDPNPYNWLGEAFLAQDNKHYTKAIKYYKKVLDMAPYVHQAYKGLYQIYHQQGKPRAAKEMLKNALEWTYELEDRKLYKYKLYSLTK